jgi:hypothetical protein
VAPGEWRGDAGLATPHTSVIIDERKRKFRWKTALFAGLAVLVLLWIVLSFTVWGNPTPEDRSMQLIQALNDRDFESFSDVIDPNERAESEDLYNDYLFYLGTSGNFSDVKFDVSQENDYDARSHIVSGTVLLRGASQPVGITEADNLIIILENHKGVWYVEPQGTMIIP